MKLYYEIVLREEIFNCIYNRFTITPPPPSDP